MALALIVVAGLAGASALLARPSNTTPRGSSPAVAGLPSTGPSASLTPSATARPTQRPPATPRPEATPRPQPTATPRPSPGSTASVGRPRAPRGPAEFDLVGQVIDIAFPLRPETEYRYRDNFLDRRAGPPDPYNHARVTEDGRLVRLHDGIDIYGPEGEPVVAPFSGRVIDPSARWTPWEPDRYGLTVVIESTEPQTEGYTTVLVHLAKVWVDVGQRVSRGQVIGVLGRSGNAEDVRPQLHFELRAPFEIDWSPIGEERLVDAFDPYPSLVEADPHR